MTALCGTCRHWAEGAQGRPGFGNCQRIADADGYAGENGHLALANNGDGTVSSWLETRAEFGCVLHSPLPPDLALNGQEANA